MIIGENVSFKIEVEDNKILLVFDRRCNVACIPWQDAENLVTVMEQVINDFSFRSNDRQTIVRESSQVKINHHAGLVYLFTEWTDRLEFTSTDSFFLVTRALKHVVDDARLANRGIIFQYNQDGTLKRIHNTKANITQEVR